MIPLRGEGVECVFVDFFKKEKKCGEIRRIMIKSKK